MGADESISLMTSCKSSGKGTEDADDEKGEEIRRFEIWVLLGFSCFEKMGEDIDTW